MRRIDLLLKAFLAITQAFLDNTLMLLLLRCTCVRQYSGSADISCDVQFNEVLSDDQKGNVLDVLVQVQGPKLEPSRPL